MPAVGVFVAGLVFSALAGVGVGAAAAGIIAGIAGIAALVGASMLPSLVMGGLNSLFGKKSPALDNSRQVNIRQAASPRRTIYGRVRVGAVITGVKLHDFGGVDNSDLHIVYTLAGHAIHSFDSLFVNDDVASLGVLNANTPYSGHNVGYYPIVTSPYFTHLWVQWSLGNLSDFGLTGLVYASTLDGSNFWTSAYKQNGCASVEVLYRFDTTVYPSGIPPTLFNVHGKELFDFREDGPVTTVLNIDDVATDQGVISCPEPGTLPRPAGKAWQWEHDTGTTGSSCGNSSLVTSPTHSGGHARKFDISWASSGGERFHIYLGSGDLDTVADHFEYDVWVYTDDLTHIDQMEFDMNQVDSGGKTIIYGVQANFAAGLWQYTSNSGGSHWNDSSASVSKWTANAWHHLVFKYHRDGSGNVTYDSVTLDGVTQTINATVFSQFTLGWTPNGTLLMNFQVNGDSTTNACTCYLDDMTLRRNVGGFGTTIAYSENPALEIYDYLTNKEYGLGVEPIEIDLPSFIAAANICDESVNLKAGGSEKRYSGNGTFTWDAQPADVLKALANCMAGYVFYSQGRWTVVAGVWGSPTVHLGDDDLRGPLKVQTLRTKRELCNGVRGTIFSPSRQWQKVDFPAVYHADDLCSDSGFPTANQTGAWVTSTAYDVNDAVTDISARSLKGPWVTGTAYVISDYVSNDGSTFVCSANNTAGSTNEPGVGASWQSFWVDISDTYASAVGAVYVCINDHTSASISRPGRGAQWPLFWREATEHIWKDLDLPFTLSSSMAQRIAKIELERVRRQVTLVLHCKLSAYVLQPGDVFYFSHPRYGWIDKTFQVLQANFVLDESDEGAAIGIDLFAQETDAEVFAWDETVEEQALGSPAGPTNP